MLLAAVAAVLSSSLAGCGRSTVGKVNGRKISRQEYHTRLERMPLGRGDQQVEAGMVVLGELIDEELWLRLAEKEKVAPTDSQVEKRYKEMQKLPWFTARLKAFGITKEQAKDLLRVEQAKFNLQTRGVKVPDKDVTDFYERQKKTQFTIPEHAEVAAIFCEAKETLDRVMSLLEQGVEFGVVARQWSSDTESKKRDGRLARAIYRGDTQVPKEVQDEVLRTKRGQYTTPMRDANGYVIFQVLNHRKQRTQKHAEVKYAIWEGLMGDKGAKKWNMEEEFTKFREKADIKVGIDRYKERLLPEAEEEEKKEEQPKK